VPSLSPRRRHSVSLPETAPTGPPQRIDQPTTPTPNPSKSTIAAITITHATNGTLISGSLEVDIVAEFPDGQLLAIEVKSRRTVTEQSWSALERFRNRYPDRKTTGVVLHGGTQVAHLHGWLHVLPMRSLWDH
jgi:hypothetical protein